VTNRVDIEILNQVQDDECGVLVPRVSPGVTVI